MKKKNNPKLISNGGEGTFIGKALRGLVSVSPEILDILGTVTGVSGLNALGDKIRGDKTIDDKNTKILLAEIQKDISLEQEFTKREIELTKRLQTDNEHPFTRLVRPVTYAYSWVVYTLIMFFDGNVGTFVVRDGYLPMIENLIDIMTVFYFGSRGVEKVAKEIAKYRNK